MSEKNFLVAIFILLMAVGDEKSIFFIKGIVERKKKRNFALI